MRLFRHSKATGVEAVSVAPMADDTVYDLYGRRVDASRLTPGIYVRGGRKIIVR